MFVKSLQSEIIRINYKFGLEIFEFSLLGKMTNPTLCYIAISVVKRDVNCSFDNPIRNLKLRTVEFSFFLLFSGFRSESIFFVFQEAE